MKHHLTLEPGEISVILVDNLHTLTQHACHSAKLLADRGIGVQLVNAGMMSRRFWKVARSEAGGHITDRHGGTHLRLASSTRGTLYNDCQTLAEVRRSFKTKVLIISGWEWTSKSYRLKESLLYHLRTIAEEEDLTIIIYSQARTNPVAGETDRGGIGKLATIALSIVRIDEEAVEEEIEHEPVLIAPDEEGHIIEYAQLVTKEINDLPGVHAAEKPEAEAYAEAV